MGYWKKFPWFKFNKVRIVETKIEFQAINVLGLLINLFSVSFYPHLKKNEKSQKNEKSGFRPLFIHWFHLTDWITFLYKIWKFFSEKKQQNKFWDWTVLKIFSSFCTWEFFWGVICAYIIIGLNSAYNNWLKNLIKNSFHFFFKGSDPKIEKKWNNSYSWFTFSPIMDDYLKTGFSKRLEVIKNRWPEFGTVTLCLYQVLV